MMGQWDDVCLWSLFLDLRLKRGIVSIAEVLLTPVWGGLPRRLIGGIGVGCEVLSAEALLHHQNPSPCLRVNLFL